ncbi:hypothetical protein N8560_01140 [bacterium]|nr:hypothetical protein [bacterium]MDA7665022.1 hypothetical protein [Verrucomicrobiota bacterium]
MDPRLVAEFWKSNRMWMTISQCRKQHGALWILPVLFPYLFSIVEMQRVCLLTDTASINRRKERCTSLVTIKERFSSSRKVVREDDPLQGCVEVGVSVSIGLETYDAENIKEILEP